MKPDPDPSPDASIVSLDSHRRRRQEAERAAAKAKSARPARAGSNHERAINWRRAPRFLLVVVLMLLFAWVLRRVGGLLPH